MNLAKHCELCDNRIIDIQTGTRCGLTGNRPKFEKKCRDIKFENNHITRIKEVNIDYHKIASTKNTTIANFIVLFSIGVAVMLGGYHLGALAWDKGLISTVPFIVMGIGFLILPTAIGPLVKYRQEMGTERNKKEAMDELLASYNMEYDIEILIDEDVNGNKDYDAEITFSKRKKGMNTMGILRT